MKQDIFIGKKEPMIGLIAGITFAQVSYFIPGFPTKDLKLNLLRPIYDDPQKKRPLLVWICGGGWITTDRNFHTPWLMKFARRGYVVASIEYRRSNSAPFPAALEDVKKAVRYLRAHAEEFGIDKNRVAIGGESAGGYLAAMAGATCGVEKFEAGENLDQSSAVSAVIDFYGPTRFGPEPGADPEKKTPKPDGQPIIDMFLGYSAEDHPKRTREAAVLTYVTENAPPYFIAHGTEDPVVSWKNSDELYELLTAKNVRADYYRIEGAGHFTPEFYQEELFEKIDGFLTEVMGI